MRAKTKILLDHFPFLVLVAFGIYEWVTGYQPGLVVRWQSVAGIILLVAISILYIVRYPWAVLLIGFTCLAGISGLVSLSPGVMHSQAAIGDVNVYAGDPWFFIFLALHLLCSARWYSGILTKRYWKQLNSNRDVR